MNWTIQIQTKACITKSSRVNERENRAELMLTDMISFLGLCLLSKFLKKHNFLEANSVPIFF